MGTNLDALQWAMANEGADRRYHVAVYGSKHALCGAAVPPWPRADTCDDPRKTCSECIESWIFAKRAKGAKVG